MKEVRTLVVEVDDRDRPALVRDHRIPIVAKPAGNAEPAVAWLALEIAALTTIVWDEREYGVYASDDDVRAGTVVRALHRVDRAGERMTYAFAGTAFEPAAPAPELPRGRYNVRNTAADARTFGLVQAAEVNGARSTHPLNAVRVAPGLTAEFAAAARVYVWMSPRIAPGTVVTAPASAALMTFDTGTRTWSCKYDAATGAFVGAPAS